MYHFYEFDRDEFMARYHQRSNIESTNSMVKRNFPSIKIPMLLGFRSVDRGFWAALRSRKLQVQILSRILLLLP